MRGSKRGCQQGLNSRPNPIKTRLQAKVKEKGANDAPPSIQAFELKGDNLVSIGPNAPLNAALGPVLMEKIKALQKAASANPIPLKAPKKLPDSTFYENLDKEVDALQLEIDAKVALEKANALKNILQIAVARIHYNHTIMEFIDNSSRASLRDFLRDQLNANYPGNPVEEQDIEKRVSELKAQYSHGAAHDLVKYQEIIQIIKMGYQTQAPGVFDEVSEYMEAKLIGDVENAKPLENALKFSPEKLSLEEFRFRSCAFYREGFEIPHMQQILEIAKSFISEFYKEYKKYFNLELRPNPEESGYLVHIVPNPDAGVVFFEAVRKEFRAYENEVSAFFSSNSSVLQASKKGRAAQSAAHELLSFKKTFEILENSIHSGNFKKTPRAEFMRWRLFKEDITKKYQNWKKFFDRFVAEQRQQEAAVVVKVSPLTSAVKEAPVVLPQGLVAGLTTAISSASVTSVSSVLSMSSSSTSSMSSTTYTASVSSSASTGSPAAAASVSIVSSSASLSSSIASLATSLSEEPALRRLSCSAGRGRKESKELLFNFADMPRRKSILGARNRQVLKDVFDDKLKDYSLTFAEIDTLITALGGKQIQQAGSRVRYQLKDRMGDVLISLPSIHSNHGKDDRNGKLSNVTVKLFRSLLNRAHFDPKSVEAEIDEKPQAAAAAASAAVARAHSV